jgi:hypothetical protein
MWGSFLIAFAAILVAGALLLGWGIPFIAIILVALVAAGIVFVLQRTAVEPTTDAEGQGRPSWATKHWWQ